MRSFMTKSEGTSIPGPSAHGMFPAHIGLRASLSSNGSLISGRSRTGRSCSVLRAKTRPSGHWWFSVMGGRSRPGSGRTQVGRNPRLANLSERQHRPRVRSCGRHAQVHSRRKTRTADAQAPAVRLSRTELAPKEPAVAAARHSGRYPGVANYATGPAIDRAIEGPCFSSGALFLSRCLSQPGRRAVPEHEVTAQWSRSLRQVWYCAHSSSR